MTLGIIVLGISILAGLIVVAGGLFSIAIAIESRANQEHLCRIRFVSGGFSTNCDAAGVIRVRIEK